MANVYHAGQTDLAGTFTITNSLFTTWVSFCIFFKFWKSLLTFQSFKLNILYTFPMLQQNLFGSFLIQTFCYSYLWICSFDYYDVHLYYLSKFSHLLFYLFIVFLSTVFKGYRGLKSYLYGPCNCKCLHVFLHVVVVDDNENNAMETKLFLRFKEKYALNNLSYKWN